VPVDDADAAWSEYGRTLDVPDEADFIAALEARYPQVEADLELTAGTSAALERQDPSRRKPDSSGRGLMQRKVDERVEMHQAWFRATRDQAPTPAAAAAVDSILARLDAKRTELLKPG
jgi:hypothetical protein